MTARHNLQILRARDELVAPPPPRACEDHTFELPNRVYVAMALFFTGFVLVLALSFTGGMAVSYGVVFAFLTAFFAIPALFVKGARGVGDTALSWAEFKDKGIATATGTTPAGEATTLVLLLPFLILCWAIAVATIAALV